MSGTAVVFLLSLTRRAQNPHMADRAQWRRRPHALNREVHRIDVESCLQSDPQLFHATSGETHLGVSRDGHITSFDTMKEMSEVLHNLVEAIIDLCRYP